MGTGESTGPAGFVESALGDRLRVGAPRLIDRALKGGVQ